MIFSKIILFSSIIIIVSKKFNLSLVYLFPWWNEINKFIKFSFIYFTYFTLSISCFIHVFFYTSVLFIWPNFILHSILYILLFTVIAVNFLYILIFILGVQLRFRQIQSMTLEVWIFGLAVDVEAWPGTPHDFLRLRLS